MLAAGQAAMFSDQQLHHKRGDFPTVNVGVTHGRGTVEPKFLRIDDGQKNIVEGLLGLRSLKQMALFANTAFATWAPNLYHYYKEHTDSLYSEMPWLRRIFGGKSVFTCAAFNFRPRVCTKSHHNQLNLAFGWHAIQAIGRFDPRYGGHLVIDKIKKIIEFPAGSLILIPSATLTHCNVPVRKHEICMSFTQYCAGGIFRYVNNGFRTKEVLHAEDPIAHQEMLEKKKTRCQMGISLWSKLEDIVKVVE
ncbi:hypothetical protein HYPSUDRAFT_201823 [Hypholoma sublateritium FD-334 SS-4]|uniref:Prolyl 4-hydroxylase alpha subunit Fe(2+) 2OG dioxygenase domain-containing protein n=1 Tax=Hypholoma sublateritium (strain FD-334 SS-4) TaxID=945553 RepID=A0A0D2NW37_HYPSF|nr:hypothetical protein HYPSUDRAFT_201823 [Hypholoma sublateritium FD-334 SS-4]